MSWIDRPHKSKFAVLPSSFRGMALAFLPISAREAFGIIMSCRQYLDGDARERTSAVTGVRVWTFQTADARCILLACADGAFHVGTRIPNAEVRDAA